jgi:hypothetical protein
MLTQHTLLQQLLQPRQQRQSHRPTDDDAPDHFECVYHQTRQSSLYHEGAVNDDDDDLSGDAVRPGIFIATTESFVILSSNE